jgi:hypothetical protein
MKKYILVFLLIFSLKVYSQTTTYVTHTFPCDTSIHTLTDPIITFVRNDTSEVPAISFNMFNKAGLSDSTLAITPVYDTTAGHDTIVVCSLCATCSRIDTIINPIVFGTVWGVLVYNIPQRPLATRLNEANNLGVNCEIFRYNWNRGDPDYKVKQMHDSGFFVLLSYQNEPVQNIAYFPTFDSILNVEKPEYAIIENEESNPSYHKGSPQSYIAELNALGAIAHEHHIPFSNGGTLLGITNYMRYWYETHGYHDSAVRIQTMAGLAGHTPYDQQQIDWYSVVIPAFKLSAMDWINVHHYEPIRTDTTITIESGVLTEITKFIRNQTGKDVGSSEFGFRNKNNSLFSHTANTLNTLQYKVAVYWDGNGSLAFKNEPAYIAFLLSLLP